MFYRGLDIRLEQRLLRVSSIQKVVELQLQGGRVLSRGRSGLI